MTKRPLLERTSWAAGIVAAVIAAWALFSPSQSSNTTGNTNITGSGNTIVQRSDVIIQNSESQDLSPVLQLKRRVLDIEVSGEKPKGQNIPAPKGVTSRSPIVAPTNTKEGNMDPLLNVLSQLGLGLATNAVYDLLKDLSGKAASQEAVTQEIQNRINMYGVTMHAETVINALAQNGFLVIQQSRLHANESLTFGSQQGGAIVGNNSALTTNRTAITAGSGAFVETQGNAQVRQNPDGSISFHVGDNGNINFKVAK